MDHMVELIRLEAFGRVKSGGKLEEQLQVLSEKMQIPGMPETAAVLQTIPASEEHPGAIYRLAGDRSASVRQCDSPLSGKIVVTPPEHLFFNALKEVFSQLCYFL